MKQLALFFILFTTTLFLGAQNAKKIFKVGMTFVESKNYKDAIAQFDNALQLDPTLAEAYAERAKAKMELEDYQGAATDFDRAITFDTKNYLNYYLLGKARFKLDQHKEAVVALEKATELEGKDLEIKYLKIDALIILKEFTKALAECDAAIEVKKSDVNYYLHGVVADSLNLLEKAEFDFGRAVSFNSAYDKAHASLAEVRIKREKYDLAIVSASNAIRYNDKNKMAYVYRAKAHFLRKEFAEAVADLSKVISFYPDDVELYVDRGVYYQAFGQHPNAITDFTRAIAIDPDDYHNYYYRATSYEAILNYKEAIRDYEKLRRLSPYDSKAQALHEAAQARLYELGREQNAPLIEITQPVFRNDMVEVQMGAEKFTLKGMVKDESKIESIVSGSTQAEFRKDTINPEFKIEINLSVEEFLLEVTDIYKNKTAKTYKVMRTESDGPIVKLIAPYASDNGEVYLETEDASLYVEGKLEDASLIKSVFVEGAIASFVLDQMNPNFSATINISNKKQITVKAEDIYGNKTEKTFNLNRDGAKEMSNNPMGKTWVVFIENSNYTSFASLEGPQKDVTLMKGAFAKYKIHNVIHKQDMTKKDFEKFFSIELRDLVRSNNVNSLLVWYAGHGKFINESGYWIPVDADRDDEFSYFNINALKAGMQAYSKYITHTLVITDACESGPSFYQAMRSTGEEKDCNDWSATRFKSSQVFSSAGYELASDNSQFTKTFANSLNYNNDACIPIDKIVNKVSEAVAKQNTQRPKFGKIAGLEDENGTFFFMKKEQ